MPHNQTALYVEDYFAHEVHQPEEEVLREMVKNACISVIVHWFESNAITTSLQNKIFQNTNPNFISNIEE